MAIDWGGYDAAVGMGMAMLVVGRDGGYTNSAKGIDDGQSVGDRKSLLG